jgi:hypothetical protein
MKNEFSGQIFEKYQNVKFYANPSSGSRVVSCGQMDGRTDVRQTDMTKVIVALRNFANALKNGKDNILGRIIAGIPTVQTTLIFCIHQLRLEYCSELSEIFFPCVLYFTKNTTADFSGRIVWAFWSLSFFSGTEIVISELAYTCMYEECYVAVFSCVCNSRWVNRQSR